MGSNTPIFNPFSTQVSQAPSTVPVQYSGGQSSSFLYLPASPECSTSSKHVLPQRQQHQKKRDAQDYQNGSAPYPFYALKCSTNKVQHNFPTDSLEEQGVIGDIIRGLSNIGQPAGNAHSFQDNFAYQNPSFLNGDVSRNYCAQGIQPNPRKCPIDRYQQIQLLSAYANSISPDMRSCNPLSLNAEPNNDNSFFGGDCSANGLQANNQHPLPVLMPSNHFLSASQNTQQIQPSMQGVLTGTTAAAAAAATLAADLEALATPAALAIPATPATPATLAIPATPATTLAELYTDNCYGFNLDFLVIQAYINYLINWGLLPLAGYNQVQLGSTPNDAAESAITDFGISSSFPGYLSDDVMLETTDSVPHMPLVPYNSSVCIPNGKHSSQDQLTANERTSEDKCEIDTTRGQSLSNRGGVGSQSTKLKKSTRMNAYQRSELVKVLRAIEDKPFPDSKTVADLCERLVLSRKQVRNWFGLRRNRKMDKDVVNGKKIWKLRNNQPN